MAITRLNSLAIPAGTVETADLSYPLTNFSSTGIDDNATSTAITIDASENVGIGTTSPSASAMLHVHKSDTNRLYLTSTTNAIQIIGDPAATGMFIDNESDTASDIAFRNTSAYAERMRITSGGNVGIGDSNPSERLELTRTAGKIGWGMNGSYGVRIGYFDDGGGVHGFHVDTKHVGTTTSESQFVIRANSGRVGIGTKNPRYNLAVKGSNATAVGIAVDNDTGGCQLDLAALGSSYASHGAGANEAWLFCGNNINLGSATGQTSAVKFLSGGSENARIDADGIKFNGDTAAANALDDYEEGTWSPTLPSGGSITVNRAVYTKVGRLVVASFYISISGIPNDNSDFKIGNLPYNNGISTYYAGGSLSYVANRNVNNWSDPLVIQNGSYIYFHFLDGSTSNAVKNANVVSISLATLIAQVVYFTTT